METERGKLPPPPGLIASLAAGFDAVARHIALIALPVILDLFLWFGPRLRLLELFKPFIDNIPLMQVPAIPNLPDLATTQQAWTDFFSNFNLFMLLRTYPVGISSLLSLQMPGDTPLGTPLNLDAGSFFPSVGWGLLLAIVGLLFGALYFQWVSNVALKPNPTSGLKPALRAGGQAILLTVFWWLLAFVVSIPVLSIITVLGMLSPALAQIGLLLLSFAFIWLSLPVFFSPHGIYAFQQNAMIAILSSLRMIRFTLPTSALFVVMMLLISQGLNFLWLTPPVDSWWLLVGIAGHAFISTALLAASFIYYRDVNAWLKVVFEHLKTQANSARI